MPFVRRRKPAFRFAGVVTGVLLLAANPAAPVLAEVEVSFLYSLSSFTGAVPYDLVRIFTDPSHEETYVSDVSDRSLRIFNGNGMEVHSFGEHEMLGTVPDGAVHPSGDIFLLSTRGAQTSVVRCNYRGEPKSVLEIRGLPAELEQLRPDRIAYQVGRLYLAETAAMKVAITDEEGVFQKAFDLAALAGIADEERSNAGLGGFNVDLKGNILFTVPVKFSAYRLPLDGELIGFGTPGQTAGTFGIISGIVSDARGNVMVADSLRSVVMIFDEDLQFQHEFGYRGDRPENLIGPSDLAFGNDRLFVSQLRHRGVSVFRFTYD